MNKDLLLVDSELALTESCGQMQGCAWLAVDTEFERVKTYYPELCLLQVASHEMVWVIDPLVIADLGPLYGLLYDPSIIKVFHAARQDLELFYHIKGAVPVPFFDTQIAATLRGYDQQFGYANLVREVLDVDLEKTQTRTNWKQRPLSKKQLEYAADDVIYLGQLYELLLAKLIESDQLSLLEEQCHALTRPELYDPDPGTMWQKIKSREVKSFDAKQRGVLQRLTAWREITARAKNRPRKWILKDHTLVEMARNLPTDEEGLSRVDGVSVRMINKYAVTWLDIINQDRVEIPGVGK